MGQKYYHQDSVSMPPSIFLSMLAPAPLALWFKQPLTVYLLMNKVQQEMVSFQEILAKLPFHLIGCDWSTYSILQLLLWPGALSALISQT